MQLSIFPLNFYFSNWILFCWIIKSEQPHTYTERLLQVHTTSLRQKLPTRKGHSENNTCSSTEFFWSKLLDFQEIFFIPQNWVIWKSMEGLQTCQLVISNCKIVNSSPPALLFRHYQFSVNEQMKSNQALWASFKLGEAKVLGSILPLAWTVAPLLVLDTCGGHNWPLPVLRNRAPCWRSQSILWGDGSEDTKGSVWMGMSQQKNQDSAVSTQ